VQVVLYSLPVSYAEGMFFHHSCFMFLDCKWEINESKYFFQIFQILETSLASHYIAIPSA